MIQRQAAFEGGSRYFLKGGLHCHTTRSDGALSPEDTIRLHAEHGYDFLALTDHRFYNYRNFAPETDLLILPGMEIDADITTDRGMCFHTVALGPEADKNGYRQDERVESGKVTGQEEFQPYVDALKAHNNLAFYCHPDWSRTPARSFDRLKGYFAMEIWNSGCVLEDEMDADNGLIWDELLVNGSRLNCVAVDDGHAPQQHCLGWVRVNAEKSIPSILDALEHGRYYSSCGPEINDFWIEDGVAHCKCSPCSMIRFVYGLRPSKVARDPAGEITEYALPVREGGYVRLVIEDKEGRRAWSNPIFC